jgi:predicted RNase H-like HicB family nuclease
MTTALLPAAPDIQEQVTEIEKALKNEDLDGKSESKSLNVPVKGWSVVENSKAVPAVVTIDDGIYTAVTPVLNGCIAQGDTIEAVLADFKNGLTGLLEAYKSEGMPVPWKADVVLPLNSDNVRIFVVDV